ncbi:MAG TPA: 2-oxo acid dehydrogenase subunit E2 [Caldilineaceae bacterium]|nr:2-oxo acid dehydrogenase subunit E2 [Caldilineaceae bacterium]
MGKSNGYRVEPFGSSRQMVAAASAVNHEQNTIHLMTEVDITEPRRLIADYRARTGERLSLTAYIVTCLARTLAEFPRFNSFRRGNRLIVLDDVTINVLFERQIDGETVPEAVGIQAANRKHFRQIHEALRAIQQKPSQHLGSATGMGWIRFIPSFLLRTFVRLASRSITMQKRFGVVAVTAVGMFGAGALWLVPLTSATVTVAVGSIVKRPAFIDGELMAREYLCLTLSFNHDIIDGAPAARFTARFAELLASGDEIEHKFAPSGAKQKRPQET